MTGRHEHLADGTEGDVRWYIERPADMMTPMVLVTLSCWDALGAHHTERLEVPAPDAARRAWLRLLIAEFQERVQASVAAQRQRRAARAARSAGTPVGAAVAPPRASP